MGLSFSFAIILLLCSTFHANATDILRLGESLNIGQRLVSLNGQFQFGFDSCYFDPGSLTYCRFAVWFTDGGTTVWDVDLLYPINASTTQPFSFGPSQIGDSLLNVTRELIRPTNSEQHEQANTILLLRDTGNLVLCDQTNLSEVLWQSFDHPTDTWLPGAWLGFSTLDGKNIELSLVSGWYTLEIDNSSGKWGYMVENKNNNITYFGTFPSWLPIKYNHGLITINSTQGHLFYLTLNSSGGVNIWKGADSRYGFHECTLDCGNFGICISNFGSSDLCNCPYGFHPASSKEFDVHNYRAGCVRNVPLNCKNDSGLDSNGYTFHRVDNLLEPPFSHSMKSMRAYLSQKECENTCLSDCYCSAYKYNTTDLYAPCTLWNQELLNMIISDDMLTGESIYIRLAISNSTIKETDNKNVKLIVGGVLAAVVILCLLVFSIFIRKFMCFKLVSSDHFLSIYTFRQIKNATKSFSTKLGERGFGSVFKGQLFDCTEIAVKKLKILGKEERQFRTEVQTLGMIRHTNLVELLGFCAEGRRRLLVYEYMPRGSLDSHLFTKGPVVLSWKARYKIAIGTAGGLAYLHEQCRDCIIHCDIKPENVLLDEYFTPKIADFGMAKLLGRDFSCALTTMRGTTGYLAPEWISGEPITQKADVYSFGMMRFEVIFGKRNATKFSNKRYPYFPLYATVKINEGDVLCLADEKLGKNVDVVELTRVCKVAGWCIQDSEACRPSMGKVVLMLQGVVSVDIPPVPRSLLNLVDVEDY